MAHVVLKKSPGWKNKLKYTQENVGAKAEPPTRQTSVVFPTRVWEILHYFFSCDAGVCHDCWLNSGKATGVGRFLRTCCFIKNQSTDFRWT